MKVRIFQNKDITIPGDAGWEEYVKEITSPNGKQRGIYELNTLDELLSLMMEFQKDDAYPTLTLPEGEENNNVKFHLDLDYHHREAVAQYFAQQENKD